MLNKNNPYTLGRRIRLYYYGARYYAPWLGRWLSCDPVGMVDGLNLYGFVHGNPICLSDKNGEQAISENTKQILNHIQDIADEGRLTSDFNDLSPQAKGTRAHLGVEAELTFPSDKAKQNLTPAQLQRIAPEVQIDEKGVIRRYGAGPEKAKKDWRTVDIGIVKENIPGGRESIVGQKASDVLELTVDYKTGNARLEKVRQLQKLTGTPVVKVIKGGNLLNTASKKLDKWNLYSNIYHIIGKGKGMASGKLKKAGGVALSFSSAGIDLVRSWARNRNLAKMREIIIESNFGSIPTKEDIEFMKRNSSEFKGIDEETLDANWSYDPSLGEKLSDIAECFSDTWKCNRYRELFPVGPIGLFPIPEMRIWY